MLEKTIQDMDSSLRRMEILAGQMVENSNIVYLANQPTIVYVIFILSLSCYG